MFIWSYTPCQLAECERALCNDIVVLREIAGAFRI